MPFWRSSLGKNVAEKIRNNENNSIQSSESVLNAESKEKLKEIEKIIDEHYLRDTDTEDLEDGMYAGILAGLNDPYSTYYTEEETKELFETTSGEYIGIGAAMSQNLDTGIITVSRVYKDSPAEKAGMRSEDILYKVEGEEVTGEELDEVVADIKLLRELVGQYGKIGSNLNQIAKYFNTGGTHSQAMENEIHQCISDLFLLRKKVLEMAGDFHGDTKAHQK